jgi:hypothetical protein
VTKAEEERWYRAAAKRWCHYAAASKDGKEVHLDAAQWMQDRAKLLRDGEPEPSEDEPEDDEE